MFAPLQKKSNRLSDLRQILEGPAVGKPISMALDLYLGSFRIQTVVCPFCSAVVSPLGRTRRARTQLPARVARNRIQSTWLQGEVCPFDRPG